MREHAKRSSLVLTPPPYIIVLRHKGGHPSREKAHALDNPFEEVSIQVLREGYGQLVEGGKGWGLSCELEYKSSMRSGRPTMVHSLF